MEIAEGKRYNGSNTWRCTNAKALLWEDDFVLLDSVVLVACLPDRLSKTRACVQRGIGIRWDSMF